MNLLKFNHLFGTELESTEVDTIAGYIIEEIGHFPEDDEKVQVQIDRYLLTTMSIESGRIRSIHVERNNERVTSDDEMSDEN